MFWYESECMRRQVSIKRHFKIEESSWNLRQHPHTELDHPPPTLLDTWGWQKRFKRCRFRKLMFFLNKEIHNMTISQYVICRSSLEGIYLKVLLRSMVKSLRLVEKKKKIMLVVAWCGVCLGNDISRCVYPW